VKPGPVVGCPSPVRNVPNALKPQSKSRPAGRGNPAVARADQYADRAPRTKHTMHDVARLAGVAVSTVSALINGAPKVSERRADRIRDAMQTLDYHPDQIARSLKVGRTHTIGVVIPDITNAFYPSLFRGIEDAARSAGYGVLLCNSNESAEQERSQLSMLVSRRVDGILLACSSGSKASVDSLRRQCPLVFVDRIPAGIRDGSICTDNREAAQVATRHLIELRHRRIALLAGDLGLSPHADRLEGFRQAMQRAGLPVREEYLCTDGVQIEETWRSAGRLLDLKPAPTAVIASNSKLLLGLLHATRERHIAVPRDLSIVTFDEAEWSEYLDPPVTAVVQPAYEMGRRAFEILKTKLAPDALGRRDPPIRLRAELHIRGSTGKPRRP
jgi:LacI family transcriptional regulator, galactose operon repressor